MNLSFHPPGASCWFGAGFSDSGIRQCFRLRRNHMTQLCKIFTVRMRMALGQRSRASVKIPFTGARKWVKGDEELGINND